MAKEYGEAERRAARRAARRKRVIRNRILFGVVVLALIIAIIVIAVKLLDNTPDNPQTDFTTEQEEDETTTAGSNDTVPPTIEGLADITVKVGDTVAYKSGVTVTDDQDPNPTLDIDNSKVDLYTPGTYEVVYTATDAAGNSTIRKITVTVEPKTVDPATQEEIDQMNYLAGLYLKQIISDDMTDSEKLLRIWLWVNWNSDYVSTSDKSSYVRGAIQYFDTHKGDCFNYYAAAKALLEKAGFKTVDVVKSDTSHSAHYWCLVYYNNGWYHFDATPRDGGGDFFYLVTDEQLDAYSANHSNSHIFDHDAYPDRAVEIITDMDAQPDYYDYFER